MARALYRAQGIRCHACTSPPAAAKVANPSIARCECPMTQSEKCTA